MTDLAEKLTSNKKRALTAIMENKTIAEAAKAARLSEKTIYRYMGDPIFRAALTAKEGEVIDGVNRRLISLLDGAISVMISVGSKDSPPGVRLRAAEAVRDTFYKMRELKNMEERLANLEAAVYANDRDR